MLYGRIELLQEQIVGYILTLATMVVFGGIPFQKNKDMNWIVVNRPVSRHTPSPLTAQGKS